MKTQCLAYQSRRADKNFVKNYKVGDAFSRKTKIIGVDSSSKGFEASIDLNKEKVTSLNVFLMLLVQLIRCQKL